MANQEASDTITRLLTVQSVDQARVAGDPFKLPTQLRSDVNVDLTELMSSETGTAPAEGARAGASVAQRAALVEMERQHRGGYRGIAGLDEETITAGQRLQVFATHGWEQSPPVRDSQHMMDPHRYTRLGPWVAGGRRCYPVRPRS